MGKKRHEGCGARGERGMVGKDSQLRHTRQFFAKMVTQIEIRRMLDNRWLPFNTATFGWLIFISTQSGFVFFWLLKLGLCNKCIANRIRRIRTKATRIEPAWRFTTVRPSSQRKPVRDLLYLFIQVTHSYI